MPFVGLGVGVGRQRFRGGFVGLLDEYSGAAAAYSLRQLSASYTGDAIRVRRASDNTELNIGFVNNVLDTASLTTFCSGTDGFVTTWYDQSGNAVDATQTTAADQPQIVSSGSVILENGKPSVGVTINKDLDLPLNINVNSLFAVAKNTTTAPVHYLLWNPVIGQTQGFFLGGTSGTISDNFGIGYPLTVVLSGTSNNGLQNLINFDYNTDYSFGLNNNAYVNMPTASTLISINRIQRQGFGVNGTIQEIIIYTTSQSSNRNGIETNINSHYGIY